MGKMAQNGFLLLVLLSIANSGMADQRRRGLPSIPDSVLGELEIARVAIEPVPLIHALSTHPNPSVRSDAAMVLGLLKETSARPALLRSLERDSDRFVRDEAALALARFGDDAGLAALKRSFLGNSDPVAKFYLAGRLAEVGAADGFSFVAESAASPTISTRVMAAGTLLWFVPLTGVADLHGRSPGKLLLDLARDGSAEVRLEILTYLGAAVLKGLDKESARSTARRLAEQDSDPKVRESAKALLEAWRWDDEEAERRKAAH